jgi:uncharacterized cupredoxin-like copper-binding protein
MKLRPFLLPLISLLVLLLAACTGAQTNNVTLNLEAMRFDQSEVQVKAGQPLTLRIINKDGYAHAFDIDEFNIHTPLDADEAMDVVFIPDKPGSYTFYCGSPGHQAAGMVGTLVVEP